MCRLPMQIANHALRESHQQHGLHRAGVSGPQQACTASLHSLCLVTAELCGEWHLVASIDFNGASPACCWGWLLLCPLSPHQHWPGDLRAQGTCLHAQCQKAHSGVCGKKFRCCKSSRMTGMTCRQVQLVLQLNIFCFLYLHRNPVLLLYYLFVG